MASTTEFTPWSTLRGFFGSPPSWVPDEDRQRIMAYEVYDQMYWNDPRQFSLRVLEGEEPIYVPNARTIVDTTAHYLLKGLVVSNPDQKNTKLTAALKAFLDREMFYSRFHIAKHAGVARGDFVLHMTANPKKTEGTRIGLNSVDPAQVFPIWDDDSPDKLIRCHIVQMWDEKDPNTGSITHLLKKLTYELVEDDDGTRKVTREEGLYEITPKWYGPEPKLVRATLKKGYLDSRITAIPVYWFKNIGWDSWEFGSSELKGFESILRAIDQGSTDVNAALSLEGLGVYATDGGRPVNNDGTESDWEVSPGKVMEVPSGSYFRRVEGVTSITPATAQIDYLESKLREAGGLSDVALGRVDVVTAQSGIALAIKFLPTLAKIEERDTAGQGRLQQMFHDWQIWHQVFEQEDIEGDLEVELGPKLPDNRTDKLNELNNMFDRGIISVDYYRAEMQKLGYEFPPDIQQQIDSDSKKKAEMAALAAPPGLAPNAAAAAAGDKPPPDAGGVNQGSQTAKGLDAQGRPKAKTNRNASRTNESGGTEAR